jgi:hypothetical protein
MGRTHKRQLGSRTYKNHSEDTLNKALNAIQQGKMSYRDASLKFKIPLGTLSNKKKNTNTIQHLGAH